MIAIAVATLAVFTNQVAAPGSPGQLRAIQQDGRAGASCPLRGTSVDAEIAGFGARVNVVQTFSNVGPDTIEAIYTFPLPHDAAVDRMRFKVGNRIIEGQIRRRDEARRIYDAAKRTGKTAALLDQERPNIFTQSVANIPSGSEVKVEISYVQLLKYEAGEFEFVFPMAVGERYTGNASDPDKISAPAAMRRGAGIELALRLDAGAPIVGMSSGHHEVKTQRRGSSEALVTMVKKDEIPNSDFIFKYQTATNTVQSAFVTCFDGQRGGFFTLILLPPKNPNPAQIAPREFMFVMDQSGSQQGFPIEKSKELTLKLIKSLRAEDTFNIFGFNNTVRPLFSAPQTVNSENLAAAESFVTGMRAQGGTQLLEGLRAALLPERDAERLRLIVFNTDGQVGDEPEILDTIVKTRDSTRIFTFGIGNSVNRFLVDTMSLEGRGDSEIVTEAKSADGAVSRFLQRTRSPILTDVSARLNSNAGASEMYPRAIPDVFSDKPIVIMGRYAQAGEGRLDLKGRLGGKPWAQSINLRFPEAPGTSAVATLWARKKVHDLQSQSYRNMVKREQDDSVTEQITQVALDFGLMTQYTSFVAVEQGAITVGGKEHPISVPVQLTAADKAGLVASSIDYISFDPVDNSLVLSGGGGGSGGFGGGIGGGSGGGTAIRRIKAPTSTPPIRPRAYVYKALERAATAKKRVLTWAEQRTITADVVVDKRLRIGGDKVFVMIWLSTVDKAAIQKLRLAGFEPEIVDNKLRIAFGVCDQQTLTELAQIEEVDRIGPIE